MKVDRKKGICPDFGSNNLDGCIYNYDNLPLGDVSMNIPLHHIQELPCLILVLIRLEFIMCLIESAFPSLVLHNLDHFLCKTN